MALLFFIRPQTAGLKCLQDTLQLFRVTWFQRAVPGGTQKLLKAPDGRKYLSTSHIIEMRAANALVGVVRLALWVV